MEKTDEIIKKVVCDRDGDAFLEMLCLPNKELKNVMNRMEELLKDNGYIKEGNERAKV